MDLPDHLTSEQVENLENALFKELDTELLERLRDRRDAELTRETLAKLTGVKDERVLERIIGLGITPDTLAAVAFIPLTAIAWADGTIQPGERKRLLTAAHERGDRPRLARVRPARALARDAGRRNPARDVDRLHARLSRRLLRERTPAHRPGRLPVRSQHRPRRRRVPGRLQHLLARGARCSGEISGLRSIWDEAAALRPRTRVRSTEFRVVSS